MERTEQAWGRVNYVIYADSPEEINKRYSKWADTYDVDKIVLCSVANGELAKNSLKHIKNDESALLLDLAAGTGLVAKAFLSQGYKGIMNAMDWNEEMLEKAKQKGLYRKHICWQITSEVQLPVGVGSYDTVTCGGALASKQLEARCIPNMARCLKPGGIIVFNTRKTEANKEFVLKLNSVMDELVQSGQLIKIEVKEIPYCQSESKSTGDVMKALLYIYKKI
ncbi:methyltransferase-like protein 27 [Styela clava]